MGVMGIAQQVALAATGQAALAARLRRARRNAIGYLIVGLLGVTAYIALVIAAAIYVARRADPMVAALLVAACAILVGLVVLIALTILNRRDERLMLVQQIAAREAFQANMLAGLFPSLPGMVRATPIATTVLFGCLAYALTRSRASK